ncbi:MAG: phage portal protein [Chelatococcus sp.]|nr:MAG: phage portal protein [Chelatococcus sp.]
MGFLDLFRRSAAAAPAAPRASVQSAGGGALITTQAELETYLLAGRETASGASITPDSAMRTAVIYGSVRLITGAMGNTPLQAKRRVDDRTRVDASDDPLAAILCRPRKARLTPAAFRRMLTAHLILRGNGYALIVRSRGRVVDLIPLHPDRVTVEQRDDLSLRYTYARRDGRRFEIPQEDMFHLLGLTLNGYLGVTPIAYAREAIGMSLTTEKHGAKVFANGASLGLHFSHPNKIGKEAQQLLKDSLEDYRGAENAGKSIVTEEGMTISPIGMTSEDAQYIETRKFTRTELEMFLGVPGFMLGDTEKSTSWGTGLEQQRSGFVAYTLEDYFTAWEETIDRDLVADGSDVFFRFNRAAVVRGDLKARWEAHVKALQWGVSSPNEIRALEDQNPREGGDVYYPPPNTAGGTQSDGSASDQGNGDVPPQTA